MKPWWEMTGADMDACLKETKWCAADQGYFRGGGFSVQFETRSVMPVTMVRLNLIDGQGPVLQFVEGYTVVLPEEVDRILYERTDPDMAVDVVRAASRRRGMPRCVQRHGELGGRTTRPIAMGMWGAT